MQHTSPTAAGDAAPGTNGDVGRTNAPTTRGELRALLGDARFRTLFLAHFTSNVGDWLAFMALFSLSAFEWKADVAAIGVLGVAYILPFALVSPWAGVWVDRWDLRRVLVFGDIARAGIVLAMAFTSSFATLGALLFLHQVVACFFNPAQHAAIARLVPREHLLAANALNSQAAQVTKILGPGIAGVLVAALGVRGCFFVDAVTFALSGLLLLTLPAMRPLLQATPGDTSFRHDFWRGVRTLQQQRRVRLAMIVLALSLCVLGAFIATLPVFARDHFGAGPRLMGLLLSALGVGAALGALAVVHAGRRWDKLALISTGMVLVALALAALPVLPGPAWGALAIAMLGGASAALVVPAHALVQEEVPAALLARVVGLILAALAISQALGMGAAALAAQHVATPTLLMGAAATLLAAGLPLAFWSRSMSGERRA